MPCPSPAASGWRRAMRLDFKDYSVEVDAEAARRAYEAQPRTDEACACSGCRNFSLTIGDALGEGGRRLFEELGVDPAKPTEACADDALGGADGALLCGAWYRLCGRIERRLELPLGTTGREWRDAMSRDVGGANVSFDERVIGGKVGFGGGAVVQMDISVSVPWVLDEPNTYLDG